MKKEEWMRGEEEEYWRRRRGVEALLTLSCSGTSLTHTLGGSKKGDTKCYIDIEIQLKFLCLKLGL